jgi:MFS transporter, BCD family, chlorophyll transporter
MTGRSFGWVDILRLGLVQACLGSIVVLTTSTLNRVMVVELALPALLPGVLVALHYLVQIVRPRMGFGADIGGRSTPWIVGGMATLAIGGVSASVATAWMGTHVFAGIVMALIAFMLIGLGVSASGTSLLVLLAKRVESHRRGAAAAIVWLMMIAGFAITAGTVGVQLEPYSPGRLIEVTAVVAVMAFGMTCVAMFRLEDVPAATTRLEGRPQLPFRAALAQVWADPSARHFTVFVFVSMLAYSSQDLILEPFAGTVFGLTPGGSTRLAGLQHAGVFVGMVAVALATNGYRGYRFGSLRAWTIGGCLASAAALAALVLAGLVGPGWPLRENVFLLGVANGAFSIGAIGSMMGLAGEGGSDRAGTRMGLWGGAQAVAFGLGGLVGTGASDVARMVLGSPGVAYAAVFAMEAGLFLAAAALAARIGGAVRSHATESVPSAGSDKRNSGQIIHLRESRQQP